MKRIWLPLLVLLTLVACPTDSPTSTNHKPVANFSAPQTGAALNPLVFDASSSSDSDKDPLTYSWDFGDGVHGGGAKIAHEFSSGASFNVTLTVSDGKLEDSTTQTMTISSPPAPSKTLTLSGLVMDTSGAKLGGVKVEVVGTNNSVTSTTDGTVSVPNVGVGVPLTIKLSKAGFADQFKPLEFPNNAVSGDAYFTAELQTREAAQNLDASAGGTLMGKDGAKLELPKNALMDASNQPISGNVSVNLTPVNVTDPNGVKGFPGNFTGIKPDGNSSLIVSHGTTEYALEQNGKRLNLAPGKQASIEIPIYANANLDGSSLKVGDPMPLWSLNEVSGDWVQEGTGVLQSSSGNPNKLVLQAKVSHFSWWNADDPDDDGKPKPKCEDGTNTGVPGSSDHFANAQICIMLADIDRGGRSRDARQTAVTLPAFRYSAAVPILGGKPVTVPANVNLIFRAYALNGTWSGEAKYRAAKGSNDEIKIKLFPVTTNGGGNTEAITVPWNKKYSVLSGAQTDQFSFSIPAGESRRITVSQANSLLEGTVRLKVANQVIDSANFAANNPAVIRIDAQTATDYSLEVVATQNAPGNYKLVLEQTAPFTLLGEETIAVPSVTKRSIAIGRLNAYRYHFAGKAGDLLRVIYNEDSDSFGASGLLRLFKGIQRLESRQMGAFPFNETRFNTTLPEDGTYTIEIAGANTFSLALLKPSRVNLDSNTEGTLTSLVPRSSFVFDGIAGSIVSFGVGIDAYSLPFENVYDPGGHAMLNLFQVFGNASITSLPISGTYTVDFASNSLVTSALGFGFGLSSIHTPTPIVAGNLTQGSIQVFGDKKYYSLNLTKGNVVRLVGFSPDSLNAHVRMRRPNTSVGFYGFPIEVQTKTDIPFVYPGTQDSSLTYVAQETGEHILELRSALDYGSRLHQLGNYSLNVLKPTPANLAIDAPSKLNLSLNDFGVYNLSVSQTGFYNIVALETTAGKNNFWYRPIVRDANMQVLTPPNPNGLGAVLQLQPGTYQLEFDPYGLTSFPVAKTDLRTFSVVAATLEPPIDMNFSTNALKNGLIDQFNEHDYYTFTANQNQKITVTTTSLDGLSLELKVYPAVGSDFTNPLNSLCAGQSQPNSSVDCVFTAPSSGKYTISLENANPSLKQTGNYRVDLK